MGESWASSPSLEERADVSPSVGIRDGAEVYDSLKGGKRRHYKVRLGQVSEVGGEVGNLLGPQRGHSVLVHVIGLFPTNCMLSIFLSS